MDEPRVPDSERLYTKVGRLVLRRPRLGNSHFRYIVTFTFLENQYRKRDSNCVCKLGSTPYPGMEAREVMRRVKEGHRLDRPSHCRPEFYRLMSRCWHPDPQRRPDFGELKAELGRLLDDAEGYIDLDNFQESQYVPLESPSDESEKV